MHLSNSDFHDFIHYKKQAGIAFFGWAEVLSAQESFQIDAWRSLFGWSSSLEEQQFENPDKIEEISKDHHLNHRFENYEFDYTVKNYLSDPDINRSKSDVPKSLKMLGILLLNEITNHIKDHHFKTRDLRIVLWPSRNAGSWIPILDEGFIQAEFLVPTKKSKTQGCIIQFIKS